MADLPPVQEVSVEIYGTRYTVHGRDPDLLRRLASLVDAKMREVAAKLPLAQYQRLAVMAALNLAADLELQRDASHGAESAAEHLLLATEEILALLHEGSAEA